MGSCCKPDVNQEPHLDLILNGNPKHWRSENINENELFNQAELQTTYENMKFELDNQAILDENFAFKIQLNDLRPKEKLKILKEITETDNLFSLSITEQKEFNDDLSEAIEKTIMTCSDLKILELNFNLNRSITDDYLNGLIIAVGLLNNLKKLNIQVNLCNKITNEAVEVIIENVAPMENLRSIACSTAQTGCTYESVENWNGLIERKEELVEINLHLTAFNNVSKLHHTLQSRGFKNQKPQKKELNYVHYAK